MLSIDYTYKTNRYRLPILDIVSFASTGQTFYVAFAFIKDEKEATYELILSYLRKAYNSLNLAYPQTILTNKEQALINTIKIVFLSIDIMIYI